DAGQQAERVQRVDRLCPGEERTRCRIHGHQITLPARPWDPTFAAFGGSASASIRIPLPSDAITRLVPLDGSREGERMADMTLKHAAAGLLALCLMAHTAEAKTWFVKADASSSGNGSQGRPFRSLPEVEAASAPGDTIMILPSKNALDHGIQLKNGQRLIGQGTPVLTANQNSAHARLTNTSNARYDGDIVRLAQNNLVQNLHLDSAFRASVFGINADGAEIRDNLMTNDMAIHDIFAIEGMAPSTCRILPAPAGRTCFGEWPNGYIIYAPQT